MSARTASKIPIEVRLATGIIYVHIVGNRIERPRSFDPPNLSAMMIEGSWPAA
jgi:hypothetical protein